MNRFHHILLSAIFILAIIPSTYAQNDLLSRVDNAVGVKLPDGYGEKVNEYLKNNQVFQGKDAMDFTERFITEQMKNNWGINRQNQYLFVWNAVIEQILDEDLYDGEDGDDARMEDFEEAVEMADACEKSFVDFMKVKSSEYDKRIEDANKRIETANKRIETANERIETANERIETAIQESEQAKKEVIVTIHLAASALVQMFDDYTISHIEPNNFQEFLERKLPDFLEILPRYNLDIKSLLFEKVKDEKKVHDILKFYKVKE